MIKPYFTIFTPVYNGEKTFYRVYESVKSQTFKNFEWIIINDGSTDKTAALVKKIINEKELNIIYIEQENSHKHVAWNTAVKIAIGELFVPADADDSFSSHTLEFFYDKWDLVKNKDNYSGINVLCNNEFGNIIGTPFPIDGLVSNNLELVYKYKVTGEKWGCIRTDLLKEIPFPKHKGAYFPEGYLWFSLAKKFSVLCYNTPLRIYYTNLEGISLGKKKLNRKNQELAIKYNFWVIKTFGFYILKNSPKHFFSHIVSINYRFFLILLSLVSNNGNDK